MPNWIYLGNYSTQLNSDTQSTSFDAMTTAQRNAIVGNGAGLVGQSYDYTTIEPVVVTGSPTVYEGVNFQVNHTNLTYTLDGQSTVTSGYGAHLRMTTNITIDGGDGGTDRVVTLQSVLYQTRNGDIFIRPYYTDEAQWEAAIAGGAIKTITLTAISRQTDNTNNLSSATAGYSANLFAPGVIVPCFLAGTMIATPQGPRAVESLRAGDLVTVRGGAALPVAWVGHVTIAPSRLAQREKLRPIRITAGALGDGVPASDLVVSPQHRILVSSQIAQRMFGVREVLVAARQLLPLDGVEIAHDLQEVTYVHFMLDGHHIVFANGAEAETLFIGEQMRLAGDSAILEEIFEIFPDLQNGDWLPAFGIIAGREAKSLVRRHVANNKPLVS